MARLLHVDLKTIHNWVNQGHVVGRRTKGRHLRFDRTEVVRFMRTYGYPIPDVVGAPTPRVVVDHCGGTKLASSVKVLSRSLEITACDSLYACALAVASGKQEIVVLDLDRRDPKQLTEFVSAVRAWPASTGAALVAVGKKPSARRQFLKVGGNAAIPSGAEAELKLLAQWLTGSAQRAPGVVELAAAE